MNSELSFSDKNPEKILNQPSSDSLTETPGTDGSVRTRRRAFTEYPCKKDGQSRVMLTPLFINTSLNTSPVSFKDHSSPLKSDGAYQRQRRRALTESPMSKNPSFKNLCSTEDESIASGSDAISLPIQEKSSYPFMLKSLSLANISSSSPALEIPGFQSLPPKNLLAPIQQTSYIMPNVNDRTFQSVSPSHPLCRAKAKLAEALNTEKKINEQQLGSVPSV